MSEQSSADDGRIERYVVPSGTWGIRATRGMNAVVAWLTLLGISVAGSRVLAVRGRSSGQWRTTPVNLLHWDGQRYLVAPRGRTQWVRNLRVSGTGELRLGRRGRGVPGCRGARRRTAAGNA